MATTTTGASRVKAKRSKSEPAPKSPKTPKAQKPAKVPRAKSDPSATKATVWAPAVKPSLVLLPPKARGLKARRQAVRRAVFMSLGLLGLTAGAYLVVLAGVAGAQAEVDKEAEVTSTQTEFLAQHRDVQEFADGFVERKAAASNALDQDVSYSRVVQAIQGANSVGASFSSIKTAAPGVACVSPSPFAPSSALGCLEVSGKAPSVSAVGQLVAALNADKTVLTEPYLTESVATEGGATFKISVGYTEKALSLKGQKFKPAPEEVSSTATPPATQGASK